MAVTATSLLQKKEIVGRFEAVYLFYFFFTDRWTMHSPPPPLPCGAICVRCPSSRALRARPISCVARAPC